jgi:hypothetical protein
VSEETRINGFWSYLVEVVLKPWLVFWLSGLLMGCLYVATWFRDNTLSKEWQDKLATQKYLPHWEWYQWVLMLVSLALVSVFWNGYKAWRDSNEEVTKLQAGPIPELVISLVDNNLGEPLGLLLKNVSHTDNLHNVTIPDSRAVFGEIAWMPYIIPCIQSNGGEVQVEPFWEPELNGQKVFINSLKRVCSALRQMDGTDSVYKIEFRVMAQDARACY